MRNILIQIVLITFTHQHEGYIIKVNKSKLIKYGVDSLLQKYLNPMRRLTEDLPNHNVEVQLEIMGSVSQVPIVEPQRRYIRYFKQPSARRYNVDFARSPPKSTTDTTTQTTAQPPTTKSTTITEAITTDSGKRLVYMDDLKQALDEFEKKLTATAPTPLSNTNGNDQMNEVNTEKRLRLTRPPALKYPIDRSLQGLVRLLRNGLELESPVARPTNEKLEWFQVKIPKTP